MSSNDFDIIYSYSRKQAIDDGVLIDVSGMAEEAGVTFPVALTVAVWHEYIVPSDDLKDQGQSVDGRLWDVLNLFRLHAKNCTGATLYFEVLFLNEESQHDKMKLKAIVGPGDNMAPVITIMLANED